ncbi:MAG: hypothetical protein ACQERR_00150 [Pseudomonadota bacterium]
MGVAALLAFGHPASAADPDGTIEAARSLDTVELVAEEGAVGLALHHLDSHQPSRADYPASWLLWERRRQELLAEMGDWQRLARRVAGYPADLPADFLSESDRQRTMALERAGDGRALRELAFQRLWLDPEPPKPAMVRHWQRALMVAYQLEGERESAVLAARLLRDSGEDDDELHHRLGVLLLELGRPAEALTHLNRVPDDFSRAGLPVEPLRLLAAWRAEWITSAELVERAARLIPDPGTRSTIHQLIQAAAPGPHERAAALEALLVELPAEPLPGLKLPTADDLWRAYRRLGREVSNARELAVGEEERWLEEAARLREEEPLHKRALLALLLEHAEDRDHRETAHRRLAISVLDGPGGDLLERLYTEATTYAEPDRVPAPIRYTLIDRFLAADDIPAAARLLRGLTEAPIPDESFDWRLRRARALIRAGDTALGVRGLHRLLDETTRPGSKELDRTIQVVFDLQATAAHEAAIEILERLRRRTSDRRVQRELLFWSADSHSELDRPATAAEYYLRAARRVPDDLDDPWVETAYYRAARALAEAGFEADATRLFERLLGATDDPRRRARLRNEMGRLGDAARATP